HDNTSFLVDLARHLIIPRILYSCGFLQYFHLFSGRNFAGFMGAKLQGYYMDASLLVVISYFLSTVLYKFKQQELQHKYNLEDLVKERTKELQAANVLLS
ncbi:MAG: hypothetical protein P4L69_18620, partial [Desulfosporosinus sp.]|nr:hypothetical protein [Desulfosporosinus sp.]